MQTRFPAEAAMDRDAETGVVIRQVTSHPAIHHQPFFMIPAYDDAMRHLFFVSHRQGSPQVFAERRATGELLQLTRRDDLNEWSVHPAHGGRHVYYTAGGLGIRLDVETLAEEVLADFGAATRGSGMVAAGMGTTALSRNDRWWAVRFNAGGQAHLAVVDTVKKTHEVILTRDQIAHMQFCPDDDSLLFYAGPLTDRVWVINRDGSGNRRIYERDRAKKEWITHEVWVPGTRELAFVDWPNGVRCIGADTARERTLARFNAWHAGFSRDGCLMVADTNFPDIGIQLVDMARGDGKPVLLCRSRSSNMGAHWNGPFPYDDGPVKVYAPQHTHPHPSFSPDGRLVVFTSDISGFAQVYEAVLPEPFLAADRPQPKNREVET